MTEHKAQPSYGQESITKPWEQISDEFKAGLELAAYICKMYGKGEPFAEAILSREEQIRGMWWMIYEQK